MPIQSWDTRLLLLVNSTFANKLFDNIMPFLSSHGHLLILPFLVYLFIMCSVGKNRLNRSCLFLIAQAILVAFVSLFLAEWADKTLKTAIGRIRPCRVVEGIRVIVTCPQSFSMPSGHAISSFAFATPLFYLSRNYIDRYSRLYPLVIAALIAYSRVYLGVHYPSDVLVGMLLGIFIALGMSYLLQLIKREGSRRKKR